MYLEKNAIKSFNEVQTANGGSAAVVLQKSEKKYTAGCLFAGIGGFTRALMTSGADIRWANEKDRFAVDTFRLNFPQVKSIHKPIEDLEVKKDGLEPVDILTAGFPCQPFSVAGKKQGFEDERGQLFNHIIRLIEEFGEFKPKILLLENVKNFRTHDEGRTFRIVQSKIQKAGYWFSNKDAAVLNTMTHTCIPQNRERIFMVAFSADYFSYNPFNFPQKMPPGSLRKVREFLDVHKKADGEFYFMPGDTYYPHFEKAFSEGDPEAVYLLRRNYVRQNKSGTCFTLMANMGDGGHNEPVIKDDWGIRKLTPRECARLQGFNEWFKIPESMSKSQIGKQLGNTITVPLAERLIQECITHLKQKDIEQEMNTNYELVFSK